MAVISSTIPKTVLFPCGKRTMLQETCERLSGIEHQPPLFICGEDHRFTVAEQLRQGGFQFNHILLEPEVRNTAPAVALAALQAVKAVLENDSSEGEPVLLVLAADHVIRNNQALEIAVSSALPFAQ